MSLARPPGQSRRCTGFYGYCIQYVDNVLWPWTTVLWSFVLDPGVGEVGDGTWDLTDKLRDVCSLKTSSYSLHVLDSFKTLFPTSFFTPPCANGFKSLTALAKGKCSVD